MNAGRVQTLLILGGNPVYDTPADIDFAAAMGQAAAAGSWLDAAGGLQTAATMHAAQQMANYDYSATLGLSNPLLAAGAAGSQHLLQDTEIAPNEIQELRKLLDAAESRSIEPDAT